MTNVIRKRLLIRRQRDNPTGICPIVEIISFFSFSFFSPFKKKKIHFGAWSVKICWMVLWDFGWEPQYSLTNHFCFSFAAFLDSSTLQLFFDLYHSIPPNFSPLVSSNWWDRVRGLRWPHLSYNFYYTTSFFLFRSSPVWYRLHLCDVPYLITQKEPSSSLTWWMGWRGS